MNVLNAAELFPLKQLILCYVNCTSIRKHGNQPERESLWEVRLQGLLVFSSLGFLFFLVYFLISNTRSIYKKREKKWSFLNIFFFAFSFKKRSLKKKKEVLFIKILKHWTNDFTPQYGFPKSLVTKRYWCVKSCFEF